MLLEVDFKIGVVLCNEELIIDVAEVVQGVVATHAVLLVRIIFLAANFALPHLAALFLVFYSLGRLII